LSLEEQGKGLVREIEAVPEDHVLHADEVEWAKALADRWAVEAPGLRVDEVWMDEPQPVQVDVSWDHFSRFIPDPSRPTYVPGHRTTVHIPFSGEKHVFRLRPSSYTLNPPHAHVADGDVQLVVEYADDRPVNIRTETDELLRKIEQHLEAARADIGYYNSGLLNMAQMAIRDRRQRIERHRAHVQATGLPVGPPRDPSKTYIADVIVRRPAPALPTARAEQPMELEPVLADEVYEHILSVIRQHGRSMERNPQTYADMGEEARRHVILDALNTHYRGAGTAEAFNFGGKTDILISHEGRSLFIAECKFWSGQKGFTDTLDQLFGYQAWRDTKLALLMFVRQRGLTAIIERGRAALEAHAQFVSLGRAATESELRATVHWRGDDRRHADLNVFFISTPAD
jgi:hypothetical protein